MPKFTAAAWPFVHAADADPGEDMKVGPRRLVVERQRLTGARACDSVHENHCSKGRHVDF